MKVGRAIAGFFARVPLLSGLSNRLQTSLRGRRARRRIQRLGMRKGFEPTPKYLAGWMAAPAEYALWLATIEMAQDRICRPRTKLKNERTPLFSVLIPVYKVDTCFLRRTLDSLINQTFDNWEACVVCADPDDEKNKALLDSYASKDQRFHVVHAENKGISENSNVALALAQGEFIALLDHDDELTPFALQKMAETIARNDEADFLYSDKDSIDDKSTLRQNALFKPEWSPEILFSVNYLTHLNVIRTSVVKNVGGFRRETDGAQDWDVFLRSCEQSRQIIRVPGVHYHWRIHPASTSTGIDAKPYALNGQLRTLQDHVLRKNLPARVEPSEDSGFHVRWEEDASLFINVIINAVNATEDIILSVVRLVKKARNETPGHIRISVLCKKNISFFVEDVTDLDFNVVVISGEDESVRAINKVANDSFKSEGAVVLLSADVESTSDNWLADITGWVTKHPSIGFTSGLILDSENNVVEAGLVVDRFDVGSPLFRGSPLRQWGIFGGPLWYRNCTAASPWMVAVNVKDWIAVGGLNESLPLESAFTKLCRSIRKTGKRGVVDPHARATIRPRPLPPIPEFHDSLSEDPYFHPAFSSVSPLQLRVGHLVSKVRRKPRLLKWLSKSVQSIFRRTKSNQLDRYASDALALAKVATCSLKDLEVQQQHPERVGRGAGAGWCNWYLPEFDHPYYGGIMTILRYADYMQREHRVQQRILICGSCCPATLSAKIGEAFPSLRESTILSLDSGDVVEAIPPADFSIATLWTTAYVLQKVRNAGLKFYFIQDWEPLFYPAGSTYAQAELTYDFGFYGITNTVTLRQLYEREHDGQATHFAPQVDPLVFHGTLDRPSDGPKRLFFYGRPGHPRNGFELAVTALQGLKERVGDRVEIICAGAPWDPREYDLNGIITSLGMLRYEETAELYRSCHIGFVMMMTRHPSYLPFEFMACGSLLVSNNNRANHWLLKDNENCLLAPASGPAIADRLAYAVDHFDQLEGIRANGQKTIQRDHSDWDLAMSEIMAYMKSLSSSDLCRNQEDRAQAVIH